MLTNIFYKFLEISEFLGEGGIVAVVVLMVGLIVVAPYLV